jgi:putative hydrolase
MIFNNESENYLFHFHTTFTDGKSTLREYFEIAKLRNITRIIGLEHIRKIPKYNVDEYVAQMYTYSYDFDIPAHIGFEAKLLPFGTLDISDECLDLAEIIGIAEHSFPDDWDLYQVSLRKAIQQYSTLIPDKTIVWVHPGLWLKKRGLLLEKFNEYCEMLDFAHQQGVFIESNLKYRLIPQNINTLNRNQIVIGVDAHHINDVPESNS